ncbi:TetR/AcrR family transcriptional regulator [Melaminivora sp.]|uniref:TetR/AcrR family transcriptional regulator n=1 Tax=Melaminivora sp. TaxID=1933032 RepID=UPI0028A6FC41|nr:TetR/AcrR family transcriptional regulator [Melaminivora sp.]
MARGRSAGYEDQRELILEHAAQLFAQRGYTAASMNEVAEACGLSKPALYHYFRDKYDLLVHIAEGHVSRLQVLVGEVQALGLTPEERLRALIQRFVLEYARAKYAHRVLTEDVKFLKEDDRLRILGSERQVVAHFSLAVGQQWPHIAAAGLGTPTAMLLFGMINWMFTWFRPEGSLTYEDLAPMVADLFFGGVPAMRLPAAPEHDR